MTGAPLTYNKQLTYNTPPSPLPSPSPQPKPMHCQAQHSHTHLQLIRKNIQIGLGTDYTVKIHTQGKIWNMHSFSLQYTSLSF
jgi:hypothetical protein